MSFEQLIESFSTHAILHHRFTLEGNWKEGDKQIRIINSIFEQIKKLGAREELLNLIDSEKPEVASLAATYSMTYNSNRCLAKMKELEVRQIPHISTAAKYAIQNWENKKWYID